MTQHNSSQAACTGAELQVGEIFTQRAWWVHPTGRLVAAQWRARRDFVPWAPGENIAECRPFSGERIVCSGPVPLRECTCGFYGYYDENVDRPEEFGLTANAASNTTGLYCIGITAMYGRCLVGTKGVRAEKARIEAVALCLSRRAWRADLKDAESIVRKIKELYKVPVYRTREELLSAHPCTDAPITPDTDPMFWKRV